MVVAPLLRRDNIVLLRKNERCAGFLKISSSMMCIFLQSVCSSYVRALYAHLTSHMFSVFLSIPAPMVLLHRRWRRGVKR